jgi:NADH dehydrogenase
MKKILVLGGTGFVGRQVCRQLRDAGWQVTVPSRSPSSPGAAQASPQWLQLDVHDEAALTLALAGQDAVVNLVAILHGDAAAFQRVHVDLPQKLARACVAAGVRQLVHVSALGTNAQDPEAPPSLYLRSKSRGEAALIAAAAGGFALTLLRPSVIFGAEDKFLNVFAKLQKVLPFVPLAGAQARFQPVWVDDVARAVLRSLERPVVPDEQPLVLELAGPEVFTLKELVQLAARLSGVCGGRGRPVLALPRWAGQIQATLMELAPGEPVMSRDNLDSMLCDNVASGSFPGLQSLGIDATRLEPVAQTYLKPDRR